MSRSSSHERMAAQSHITWTRARDVGKSSAKDVLLAKVPQEGLASASNAASPAPPAGSPYGSVSQGASTGFEVRPALWASGTDPIVLLTELAGGLEGDVVVEITIDEQGNVVRTALLQSLSPTINAKVLAALATWRFRPATRDGVAIASKQDVYYHFPARR